MQRHTERSPDSRKAVWAVALVLLLALPAASPALAGRIDKFTNGLSEVGLDLRAGGWENSTTITFPPDCRVKDASVTLMADQSVRKTVIEADRGNVSAWSAKPATFDPRALDPGALEVTAFTAAELTAVALNTTASGKTTVSGNASAQLFSYDVASVLGGAARDLGIKLVWLGMGTRQGAPPSDDVWLYVSDFAQGRWHMWGHISKSPAQGIQELQWEVLSPRGAWTNETGHMFLLAITLPISAGTGTSLTTSYVEVELTHTMSPRALEVDVGQDGTDEFFWDTIGEGLYGLQEGFADGSASVSASVSGHTERRNVTSFLVPSGASIEEAQLTVAGTAGEVTDSASGSGTSVPAQGISAGTNVTGIADYSEPVWAQVVLTGLKNAGMEDQKQTTATTDQIIGNYGTGTRSTAQTFKSSVPGRLVYLNLSLSGDVYTNAPNITIEIRTTNATGAPTNTTIGSTIFNGSLVYRSNPIWYLIPMPNIELEVGTQYAIVLSAPNALGGQTYQWRNHFQPTVDPYRYGASLVSDTSDGSGPWTELSNTDQAFITYMETDITIADMAKITVAGEPLSYTDVGPLGREYVYNVTPVFKDAFGVWTFAITNGNDFPILTNWSAAVHSDVYPQGFGISLSTAIDDAPYWSLAGDPVGLQTIWLLSFKDGLETIMAGAPVARTSPSGVAFVQVNVTVVGNMTGAILLEGLRVRYRLDVPVTGPAVVAAAEAYRAAHATQDQIVLPIAVRSECDARVLLGAPLIVYDLRPFFVTTTQTMAEDTTRTVDLNTLFSDDIDFGRLRFVVLSVSQPANLSATLDGANLTLAPSEDWYGELDVVVRGIDSSDLSRDGTIHVIVTPVNDAPVLSLPAEFKVQARSTEVINLSTMITDVDSPLASLVLEVNSSFVTVNGMELTVSFDDEGIYRINLTVLDGSDSAQGVLVFNVSAAAGWPSISPSLPDPMLVHINKHLAIDLLPYGSDAQDAPDKLRWSLRADASPYYTAAINASGHWLIIEPTGAGKGNGTIFLTLTDTDGQMVSVEVVVSVVDRLLEPPAVDTARLPAKVGLVKDGAPFVLDLRDYVTDDTPAADLRVAVAYSKADVAYVDNQSGKLSFVPQEVGKTRVTITLTDSDNLSTSFALDVEVKGKARENEVNWWLWIILLVVLAAIITIVAWPRRPAPPATAQVTPTGAHAAKAPPPAVAVEAPPRRAEKVRPHVFHASSLPQLEEVLLFHRDGKLLSQHSRRLREGVDAEIESGVISAIQDHLKGRMRARDEPADLIELEGMRVVIERGADLAIAAMLTGREPDSLRILMRRTLHEVQTRNDSVLDGWTGDVGSLRGVDNAMVGLVESLIREEGGTERRVEEGPVVPPPRHEMKVRQTGPEAGEEEPPEEGAPPPPLERREPLKLVKGIIGEERAEELVEGKPKPPQAEGGKDDALVKDMLDREKQREEEEDA